MLKKLTPLVFILFWIVPVAWVGLMRVNYPLYPSWIAPLFRVSGVFESSPNRWRIYFIEFQDKSEGDWRPVDEKLLFAQTPLGERTRFQNLMSEMDDSKSKDQVGQLLGWITGHIAETGHSLSQIKSIRIIHVSVPPETFLQCVSLLEVYKMAKVSNMPLTVDASLSLPR